MPYKDLDKKRKYQREWIQNNHYDLCACGGRKKMQSVRCQLCRTQQAENEIKQDITAEEVAWIAGIMEGEGCWSWPNSHRNWFISVKMSDEDIIKRLKNLTGIGTVRSYRPPGKSTYKQMWHWSINSQAQREWITLKVWPWLGERRQTKIRRLWPDMPS